MRIPFPERVPINRAAIFAVALFLIQRLEGTPLYFSTGCLLFILIATVAFNLAGGLTRASGAYIFFYAILVVIVGVCYKAYLGEPAQSNLRDPRTDIKVYVAGITGMLAAVIVSRRFARKTGLLQNILKESQMYRSSVGSIAVGAVATSAIGLLGESGERLQSAFGQLNQLVPLGILIGVMYEIRRSGGTRSVNLPILVSGLGVFLLGILDFSKQGMLTPLLCWFLPVCVLRYSLSRVQVLSILLGLFVIFHYLVPYSQYGRRFLEPKQTLGERIAIALPLLEHPEETRKLFESDVNSSPVGALGEYFNSPQGFWDRLQEVSVDDSLVNVTDEGTLIGMLPLKIALYNSVPHVFWPDKPQVNFGMLYVHEITHQPLDQGDMTTGISFSPTAEAYHIAKWVGVLVIAPLLWCLLFIVYDSLFGDLRATPWGMLAIALISHSAPESALGGVINLISFGSEILVFCALFATYAAPIFADFALGPERQLRMATQRGRQPPEYP